MIIKGEKDTSGEENIPFIRKRELLEQVTRKN